MNPLSSVKPTRRILRFAGAAATVFIVAWFVGLSFPSRLFDGRRPKPADLLSVSSSLPDGIVHLDDGSSIPLHRQIASQGMTAIILFSTRCGSCAGEAIVWKSLAEEFASHLSILAIATTPDKQFLRSIIDDGAARRVAVMRAGDELVPTLRATGLPTIYVVDSNRTVLFAAAGDRSTSILGNWLRRASPRG